MTSPDVCPVKQKRLNANNTRFKQRQFLAAVEAQGKPVSELIVTVGVSARRFGFWMQKRRFRRELSAALRRLARLSEVDLRLASYRASAKLDKIAGGGPGTNVARQACVDLVRLEQEARKARRTRRAAGSAPSLAHPDLDPADARELTARLRGNHER